jgi:hypothetical protein
MSFCVVFSFIPFICRFEEGELEALPSTGAVSECGLSPRPTGVEPNQQSPKLLKSKSDLWIVISAFEASR